MTMTAHSTATQRINRILITNDDGIDAKGITVMTELAEKIANEVWVVAPESNSSGASQSVSLHRRVGIKQLDKRRFAIAGTPSDCVLVALNKLMPEQPDLIISGINEGINIADTVGISGTLGAALTGALFDMPALAISQAYRKFDDIDWNIARRYLPEMIRSIQGTALPAGVTLNINLPSATADEVKGVVNTSMNQRSLIGAAIETEEEYESGQQVRIRMQHNYGGIRNSDSDVTALRDKSISVSFIERNTNEGLNAELFKSFASATY